MGYRGELAVDIATKFSSVAKLQYSNNAVMWVEGLYMKMRALMGLMKLITPEQDREIGVIANLLLYLIPRLISPPEPASHYLSMKANAYHSLGVLRSVKGERNDWVCRGY